MRQMLGGFLHCRQEGRIAFLELPLSAPHLQASCQKKHYATSSTPCPPFHVRLQLPAETRRTRPGKMKAHTHTHTHTQTLTYARTQPTLTVQNTPATAHRCSENMCMPKGHLCSRSALTPVADDSLRIRRRHTRRRTRRRLVSLPHTPHHTRPHTHTHTHTGRASGVLQTTRPDHHCTHASKPPNATR